MLNVHTLHCTVSQNSLQRWQIYQPQQPGGKVVPRGKRELKLMASLTAGACYLTALVPKCSLNYCLCECLPSNLVRAISFQTLATSSGDGFEELQLTSRTDRRLGVTGWGNFVGVAK